MRTKQWKAFQYPMWLHWFLFYMAQQAMWWTSARGSVENIWHSQSCIAKIDICLLWGTTLTKEQIFVLKTYYAMRSYRRMKETFRTEFPNSATMLSDSSILWLIRKFEEAGSV